MPRYQPLPRRRRLLILLLAVTTALTVAWLLLAQPGSGSRERAPPEACKTPGASGCLGGKVEVLPAAPPPVTGAASR